MSTPDYHLGLIGYPLEHSLSPRLHRAALAACGLRGEYRLYPVPPGESRHATLGKLFGEIRRGRLDGLNVTIPLKQVVIEHLDRLTPAAQSIGAVNTIFRESERLVGDNTDAPGFLADLRRHFQPHGDRLLTACILGAGGAARAVAYALHQEGWGLLVAARRQAQAQELVAQLTRSGQSVAAMACDLETLAAGLDRLGEVRLIVNATPLGMVPGVERSPWPEAIPLPQAAFIYDLVYNPAQTALMAQALRAGLGSANGSGMLIEQAALAFERWTGQPAPRPAMWSAMMDGG